MPTWTRITENLEGAGRIFAVVEEGSAAGTWIAALGQPLAQPVAPEQEDGVFFPSWMLEQMGLEGVGELMSIEWFSEEAFPEAQRIVLRPHDSAFYHADAKEELELALTRLGAIKQGSTIKIPLSALGGYEVAFDIVSTEPATIVLAHGEEVAIEFEEALDAATATPTPTPTPTAPMDSMFETEAVAVAAAPTGQSLGGGPVRRMPDGRAWNPWRNQHTAV